jgi:hypothetical protein
MKDMKKIFAVVVAAFLMISFVNAQTPSFNKGDKVLDITLGVPNLYGYGWGIPPIIGSFEVGIVDGILEKAAVGVGGYAGFSSASWLGNSYFNFHFGVKGAFHYPFVDNLDTYAGIITGYSVSDLASYGLDWGGFVGIRYYFSNSFGVNAEAGYGVTWLRGGITFKF